MPVHIIHDTLLGLELDVPVDNGKRGEERTHNSLLSTWKICGFMKLEELKNVN